MFTLCFSLQKNHDMHSYYFDKTNMTLELQKVKGPSEIKRCSHYKETTNLRAPE